jgi:hypothetical protein
MKNQAILEGIKDVQGYNNQNNYSAHERVKKHVENGWECYGKQNFDNYDEYLKDLVESEDWAANGLENEVKIISEFYQ